jgi:hypothetical protein
MKKSKDNREFKEFAPGVKDDHGKLRWDLIPIKPLKEIAKVYNFGLKKYSENSWQNLPNARSRYYAAAKRHLEDWWDGDLVDEESGLHPLAHTIWNLICLIWFDFQEKKLKIKRSLKIGKKSI